MSVGQESISRTLLVTLVLCVFASFFVSMAAVLLKDEQELNQLNEKKKNILKAAGLIKEGEQIDTRKMDQFFEKIKISIVDFETGKKLDGDVASFDQLRISKDLDSSIALDKKSDIAGIKRRENQGLVYELVDGGTVNKIIIPIRGYGLWSTLYGFLALSSNGKNIKGITFYQHGETPGLGGEVDNPKWKSMWVDKKAFDGEGRISIRVVKGTGMSTAPGEVDGISGATITSKGVENMLHFWLSDMGYGKYLKSFFL